VLVSGETLEKNLAGVISSFAEKRFYSKRWSALIATVRSHVAYAIDSS